MKKFVICLVFVLLFFSFTYSQTKSMTGKVVYYSTGASGNFEVIEVQVGNNKYEVYLFRKDLPSPKIVGNVTEVGRTVQIFYSSIVDGEIRATRVVEVKKSKSRKK